MEDSLSSSMDKALSLKGATGCPEESGWTEYFEDLLSNNREYSSCSSGFGSSSLVSDAASCAAWKFSDHHPLVGFSSEVGPEQSRKKLSLRKKRNRGILDDAALEDTASSPVNSPKVSDLKHLDINPRKKDDENSQGVGLDYVRTNLVRTVKMAPEGLTHQYRKVFALFGGTYHFLALMCPYPDAVFTVLTRFVLT